MDYENEASEGSAAEAARETSRLAAECAGKGILPFATEEPLPRDMNMASGASLLDFNKSRVELLAAKAGLSTTRWIFEADAKELGLEPSERAEPFLVYAAVDRGSGPSVESQRACFLDHFTGASVARALTGGGETALSRNFIRNCAAWDSAALRETERAAMRASLKRNFDPSSPAYAEASAAYKAATEGLSDDEKFVFDYMNARCVRQACGLKMAAGMDSPAARERAAKAIGEIARGGGTRLSELLSEAFFYSDRTLRMGFSPEAGYGYEGEKVRPLPPAAKFERGRQMDDPAAGRKVKMLRDRDRTLRPSHTRG